MCVCLFVDWIEEKGSCVYSQGQLFKCICFFPRINTFPTDCYPKSKSGWCDCISICSVDCMFWISFDVKREEDMIGMQTKVTFIPINCIPLQMLDNKIAGKVKVKYQWMLLLRQVFENKLQWNFISKILLIIAHAATERMLNNTSITTKKAWNKLGAILFAATV